MPQSEVVAMLDREADTNPSLSSFRDLFPQDWEAFKEATSADIKSSISADEVKAKARARVRSFMIERVAWTAAAPSPDLNAALSAERAFVEQLSTDSVEICARYGLSGLNGSETLSAEASRLLNDAVRMRFNATSKGRDTPQAYGEITAADADVLISGMANAGASRPIIDLILSDAASGTASQQCEGTVAIYRSMDNMADGQAARVYASILRGAAAEQRARTQ
jgi:hypothetical protein